MLYVVSDTVISPTTCQIISEIKVHATLSRNPTLSFLLNAIELRKKTEN